MLLIRHLGLEPFDFEIIWKPLKSLTEKEIAETNNLNSQTDVNLQMVGAVDGDDIRNRLIADPHSGYSGLEPFEDMEE